ncbi:hypothetical protein SAMN05216570_3552 [Dyella sp. OK004]|uniref:HutD/Ves family protein n=1 Tax=Dyella sp. OK004 TaxID=1855292 RepID=UPI0008EEA1CC|nr:HutD family protein [Dyella sp. OK004]SFS17418.1 hypothetical protein SAMN05216570_3552 [Dyella sp. OK004]
MSPRIIRAADCPPQPWKNGMGRTREIAAFPPGADMASFLWRISVAEVDSAAPFSVFPGVDRHIALLDGAGFSMTLNGAHKHQLDRPYVPFAFPGEASVTVSLIDGATRDFNLMLRRGQAVGRIDTWLAPAHEMPGDDVVLIYCARGEAETTHGVLQAGDALLSPRPGTKLELRDGTVVLAVSVELRSGS